MPLEVAPMDPADAVKALRLGPFAAQRYRVINGIDNEMAGSTSAEDLAELRASFPACDESAVHLVAWVAHSLLVAVEDHIEALARAIDEDLLTFSPATLTRGAVEGAARIWWMLDPSGGAIARQARCISLRLASAHEMSKAHRGVGASDERFTVEIAALDAEAKEFGLSVTRRRKAAPQVDGYVVPRSTHLVAAVLGGVGGEIAYRILSGAVHSSIHSTLGRMQAERSNDVVSGYAGRGLSRQEIGRVTSWTVSAYLSALHRWSWYVGWEPDLVDSLRQLLGISHLVHR